MKTLKHKVLPHRQQGPWRNGSASDSRSEGWEFESLWPHLSLNDCSGLKKTMHYIYIA